MNLFNFRRHLQSHALSIGCVADHCCQVFTLSRQTAWILLIYSTPYAQNEHTMNSLSSSLASLCLTKLTFEWYTYLANTISWPISYPRTNQQGSKAQTSTPNSTPSQPRDLPEVPWSLATLITWCSYYISSSLAPSTRLVYTSALKSYHCFCQYCS